MLTRITFAITIFIILNRNPLTYIFHDKSVILGAIAMGVCTIAFLIDSMILKNINFDRKPKINSIDVLVILFISIIILRSLFQAEISRSLIGISLYLGFIPAYFIMRAIKFSSKEIFSVIIFCFAYLSFFGYLQWFTAIPLGEMPVRGSAISFYPMRIHATLGSNLHFGVIYTIFTVLVGCKLLLRKKNTILQFYLFILTYLIAIPLIVGSSSRGGMVLFLFASALLLLHMPLKIILRTSMIILSAILLSSAAFPQYLGSVSKRLFSTFNFNELSNFRRMSRYSIILDILKTHPTWLIWGVGIGFTGNILAIFNIRSIFDLLDFYTESGTIINTTESYILKLLLETGIIGLGIFILIFLASIWSNHIKIKQPSLNIDNKWLCIGSTITICTIFLNCFNLQSLEIPMISLLFWSMIGVSANDI